MDTVASEIDGEDEAAPQPKDSLQPACACNPPAILRPRHLPRCRPGESRGPFVRERDAGAMGPGFRRGGE
jgi:hypothetical protein